MAHIYVTSLLLFILTSCVLLTNAGLVCRVDMMDPPQWFEPGTDYIPVEIRYSTTNTVGENVTSGEHIPRQLFVYGVYNSPRVHLDDIKVTDLDGVFHTVEYGCNGTHFCVAIKNVSLQLDGSTTERCTQQCQPTYSTTWEDMIFFVDNTTDVARYSHLSVVVSRGNIQISLECYTAGSNDTHPDKSTDCEIPLKCVVSVSQKTEEAPLQYRSSCQPDGVSCTNLERCQYNTEAPYLGSGAFTKVCNYCCSFDRCNDVRRCTSNQGECDFYGPPSTPTIEPGTGTSAGRRLHVNVLLWVVLLIGICS